jgi:hypothetical protein
MLCLVANLIRGVFVGPAVQKQPHALGQTFPRGQHQWRKVVLCLTKIWASSITTSPTSQPPTMLEDFSKNSMIAQREK